MTMAACASLALLIAAAWTPSGTHGAVRDRDSAFIGYSERSRSEAGNCKDEAPHCEDWATDGECDANPRFMKISCRKSCNTCGSDSRLPSSCTTCATLQLATAHGMIPILMRSDWSPKAVEAVLALLGGSSGQLRGPLVPPCKGCELYRSEKVPPPGVSDNFGGPGPPYALLQVSGEYCLAGAPAFPLHASHTMCDMSVWHSTACLKEGNTCLPIF
mmetsp:Transcript_25743/g.72033  ORF Transcript_25743/g.72033 Transcript_25743/m.72033 type:complete len:216 (+) Transcript_25743:349-996(+)